MRLLVHDFAGHPFPIELSRALAARGHTVAHVYCGSLTTTPHGALARRNQDPASLTIVPITLGEPLAKFDFAKRWRQENAYGRVAVDQVLRFKPDAVLSGNTPLDAQKRLISACRRADIPFVFWAQDLIGIAAKRLLAGRWFGVGSLIGEYYALLERRLFRASSAVVAISEDFVPTLSSWGVDEDVLEVIENWATLDELPTAARDNDWARENDLVNSTNFVYSGTLGLKHNPDLLLHLAIRRPTSKVVVVSQGLGADWLARKKEEHAVKNLILLPFQPYSRLPEVLASADVLVAILEPDADVYSVPSKVLSYLCAERPLLLAVPVNNLAARIVKGNKAGLVAAPTDMTGFMEAADTLGDHPLLRVEMAENGRRYAEKTFDIVSITDRFEALLRRQATLLSEVK